MEIISFDEFKKMDIRVGKILEVKDHPDADKLYVLTVDIGDEIRKIVAGIRPYYQKEELTGKLIIVLTNLQPRTIRGIESKGMLLAGLDGNNLGVLTVDKDLRPGTKIS
ncbi:MAG: methionine--tRNA ligase subunit beta [Candidatus Omnitrophica bacterium]|nr:methionine--tRNA ligase subunit beta [Candidatus Omnitrophota bacterium]